MLARSEQSGISEPEVGNAQSHSDGLHSAGPQSVTHQSLLDVSQAILQHRDLAGLFRDLAVASARDRPLRFPESGSLRRSHQHHAAAYPGKHRRSRAPRARDGISAGGFAVRMGVCPPAAAGHPGRQPGDALAEDHGRAETQPRGQFLLVAAHHRATPARRADVRLRRGRSARIAARFHAPGFGSSGRRGR